METQIDQCKHCQHEEEECPSPNYDPREMCVNVRFQPYRWHSLALGAVSSFWFLVSRNLELVLASSLWFSSWALLAEGT